MPKMKSKSGAKKRFRVNKKGTVKYRQAFARHNFTSKAPARKRQNRGTTTLRRLARIAR